MTSKKIEPVGHWFSNPEIEIYRINNKYFAFDGWNGESWADCWQVKDKHGDCFYKAVPGSGCSVRPVYRFQAENIDLDTVEENGPEWCRALEIVDFEML